jgi:hypothetical protein
MICAMCCAGRGVLLGHGEPADDRSVRAHKNVVSSTSFRGSQGMVTAGADGILKLVLRPL